MLVESSLFIVLLFFNSRLVLYLFTLLLVPGLSEEVDLPQLPQLAGQPLLQLPGQVCLANEEEI